MNKDDTSSESSDIEKKHPSSAEEASTEAKTKIDRQEEMSASLTEREKAVRQLTQILEDARLKTGRDAEELAHQMNIPYSTFMDLEAGTLYDHMNKVFVRGYVLSYAKILKLEEPPLLDLLNVIYGSGKPGKKVDESVQETRKKHSAKLKNPFMTEYERTSLSRKKQKEGRMLFLPVFACLLVIGGLAYWKTFSDTQASVAADNVSLLEIYGVSPILQDNDVSEEFAQNENDLVDTQLVEEAQDSSPESDQVFFAPSPEKSRLLFSFLEETWLGVSDNQGKEIAWQLFGPGEKVSFTGIPPYTVVIGNAPSTRVWYEGKEIKLQAYTEDKVARLQIPSPAL